MRSITPTPQLSDDVLADVLTDIDDTFDATTRGDESAAPVRTAHRRWIAIGATALAALGASLAVVQTTGDDARPSDSQTGRLVDRTAITEDLVNRGLIPRQAVESTSSSDATLRDLVNRGLVPRQALDARRLPASTD